MIRGIGIDTEDIKRFSDIKEKHSLMNKCFTEYERLYIISKVNFAQTAAGIFCAKEALFKALKTGIGAFPFLEAEVKHDDNGAPYYVFYGALEQHLENADVLLSISHNDTLAVAQVLIQDKGEK